MKIYKNKVFFILCLISCLFLFTGCESIAYKSGYVKKQAIEKQIEDLKIEKQQELNKKVEEVIAAKDANTAAIQANFQKTADYIFGAQYGLNLFPTRDRLWTIVDNRLNVAAQYAPAPTKEALVEQVRTLKEELDTTRVSNEELASRYNQKVSEANEAVKIQKEKEEEIANKQKELEDVKENYRIKEQKLQNDLNLANNQIIANEKKRSDEAILQDKRKRWASSIVGGFSLLALAAAIFSPIWKDKFGWLSGILGIIAISILFLETIHIVIGLCIIFSIGLLIAVHKYNILDRGHSNLVNYIQEKKNQAGDAWEGEKEKLKDWNSKYKVVGGKTVKVEDSAVEKLIDEKLKDNNHI